MNRIYFVISTFVRSYTEAMINLYDEFE